MVMQAAMIITEQQKLAWPYLSSLTGTENGHTRAIRLSTPRFLHGKCFRDECSGPPNQAYRVHLRFLASRQGKKELSDYVRELRTLLAAMQLNPLAEEVKITIFMEGLCTVAARTKGFRVHPSTF